MREYPVEQIQSWHAHVYFDGDSRDRAKALHDRAPELFPAAEIGRFHDKPVGPHPMWSFQIAFAPDQLFAVTSWFALNRNGLDVFIHPNTGDALTDHRDRALWIGRSYELDLEPLK